MTTIVDCPTCHKKVEWTPNNRHRPFCSERCKLVDLGAWATEKYSIKGSEAPPSAEETAATRSSELN